MGPGEPTGCSQRGCDGSMRANGMLPTGYEWVPGIQRDAPRGYEWVPGSFADAAAVEPAPAPGGTQASGDVGYSRRVFLLPIALMVDLASTAGGLISPMAKPVKTTTTKPSSAAPKKTVKSLVAEPLAPVIEGNLDAVQIHRGRAAALRLDEVLRFGADPHLAHHNMLAARAALLAARADVDATGFAVDWARVEGVESLALAVIYAAGRVPADPRTTGELLALLAEARPLRALLLSNARTLSLVGRCSPEEVARIERGRGAVDSATDLIDLATLHANRELTGAGSAVTAAQLKRAKALGTEIVQKVRPAGASRASARTADQQNAVALRDRLWTLLVQTHDYFERIAGARWGRDLGKHVPRLQARYVAKKRAKKSAEPVAPTG